MRTFVSRYMSQYPRESLLDLSSSSVQSIAVSLSFTVDQNDLVIVEQIVDARHTCRALARHIPNDIFFMEKGDLKKHYKDDKIANVLFRDLFDNVIDELYIEITIAAGWAVSIDECLRRSKTKGASFLLSREEQLPHLLKYQSGPQVSYIPRMVALFKDGKYHHPHYPAYIGPDKPFRWGDQRGDRFYQSGKLVVMETTRSIDHCTAPWIVQYCKNGVSTLNKSGIPSCFKVVYTQTFDNLFAPLYLHRPDTLRKFLDEVVRSPKVTEKRYDWDDHLIPDDILGNLRFPLDEFEEFDLMMRL